MAMDVYDQLAHATQAAYAEKEVSEDARTAKIRAAFDRAGYQEHRDNLGQALQGRRDRQEG